MINVYDNKTGNLLGAITQQQLDFLVDSMEEESTTDQDYYVDEATLGYLEARGADADLLALLGRALGEHGRATIRWERD